MIEKLRIWWIPQVPLKKNELSFHIDVDSPKEAKKILDVLARYDIYQFKHKIKPDYSNAGGLQKFEDGEWLDWECPECCEDIDRCECIDKK